MDRVTVTDVLWDGVPEVRGRVTEGCRPHSGQVGEWFNEVDGRRG